jgi:hypothetical protein
MHDASAPGHYPAIEAIAAALGGGWTASLPGEPAAPHPDGQGALIAHPDGRRIKARRERGGWTLTAIMPSLDAPHDPHPYGSTRLIDGEPPSRDALHVRKFLLAGYDKAYARYLRRKRERDEARAQAAPALERLHAAAPDATAISADGTFLHVGLPGPPAPPGRAPKAGRSASPACPRTPSPRSSRWPRPGGRRMSRRQRRGTGRP